MGARDWTSLVKAQLVVAARAATPNFAVAVSLGRMRFVMPTEMVAAAAGTTEAATNRRRWAWRNRAITSWVFL